INKNILNTQSTTIGIGTFLIHAFSSALTGFRFDPALAGFGALHSIWPQPSAKIHWPPLIPLTDLDVDRLGSHLRNYEPGPCQSTAGGGAAKWPRTGRARRCRDVHHPLRYLLPRPAPLRSGASK